MPLRLPLYGEIMNVQSDNGIAPVDSARVTEPALSDRELRGAERAGGAKDSASSSVELSADVADVEQIADIARAESDFRADVVAQAQADLDAGALVVDSAELAALISYDLF